MVDNSPLDASVTRQDGHYCLKYEVQPRIFTSLIYPLESPNGSSVIVSGTDEGLSVSWRGGRRPKRPRREEPVADDPSVIILDDDSDDGAAQKKAQPKEQEYHDHADAYNESSPYDQIIHQAHFSLKTGVMRIAVPDVPYDISSKVVPPLLRSEMLLLLSCSDTTVRLVTVPLAPAFDSSITRSINVNQATFGDDSIATGVSLTWTTSDQRVLQADLDDDTAMEHDSDSNEDYEWDILVAASQSIPLHRLTVYSVPLLKLHGDWSLDEKGLRTVHGTGLQSPVVSLEFSTARLSSPSRSYLIIAQVNGTVRLFDPTPRPKVDTKGEVVTSPPRWLTTFTTPFEPVKSASASSSCSTGHKRILQIRWGRGGNSIIALLEGGEWGLWELGASASPSTHAGLANVSSFALRGVLGDSSSTTSTDGSIGSLGSASGKLAPMTPNTRKAKSNSLFSTTPSRNTHSASHPASSGTLAILPSQHNRNDSALLFAHGQSAYYLPSLASYWHRARKSTGAAAAAGTLYGPNIPDLPLLSTGGERVTATALFQPLAAPVSVSSKTLQQDILVAAEHRFMILSPGKPAPPSHPRSATVAAIENRDDELLLARGDLDLGGVDRMLDGMSRARNPFSINSQANPPVRERRVGFADEHAPRNPFAV